METHMQTIKRIALTCATIPVLAFMCTSTSYANYSDNYYDDAPSRQKTRNWRTVIGIGGGAAITRKAGEANDFPIKDPASDSFYNYTAERSSQTAQLFSLFLGAEWPLHPSWEGQLGIGYRQTRIFPVKGTLTQGADVPSQDSFTYNYNIVTKQLVLEGKLLYNYHYLCMPYLTGGLGFAMNKSYGFTPNIPANETFTRNYTSHTNNAFSYSLGIGVDIDMGSEFRVGAGYRFTNLGEVKLGGARIDGVGQSGTLIQSSLDVHEFYGELTFLL